jgi:hypothetical protein
MEKVENIEESPIMDMNPIRFRYASKEISEGIHAGVEKYEGEMSALVPYLILEVKRLQQQINELKDCKFKCYMENTAEGTKKPLFSVSERLAGITPVLINDRPSLIDEQVVKYFPECYEEGKINYKSVIIMVLAIIKDLH